MTQSPITAAGTGRSRAPGTTAQALGLLLMGLVGLTFLLAGTLIGGATEDTMPAVIALTVGGLVGAVLAARFGTWSKVLGIVLAIVMAFAPPILTFWAVFGVFQVEQATEFAPGLMYLFGFLMAVVGGIVAIVKRRSGAPTPGRGERTLRTVVVTLVVIAAGVSIVLSVTSPDEVTDEEAAGTTEVVMADFEFQPDPITVPAGEVSFLLRNEDGFAHNFSIEELEVTADVNGPGEMVVAADVEAGTYEVVCIQHEQLGMVGTLTVE